MSFKVYNTRMGKCCAECKTIEEAEDVKLQCEFLNLHERERHNFSIVTSETFDDKFHMKLQHIDKNAYKDWKNEYLKGKIIVIQSELEQCRGSMAKYEMEIKKLKELIN